MNFPDQDAFVLLSGQSGLVPVHRTIIADLDTPLTIYAKVSDARQHAFLFESMEGGEKWGRYSFIGLDPLLTFTSRDDRVTVTRPGTAEAPQEQSRGQPAARTAQPAGLVQAQQRPGSAAFLRRRRGVPGL